MFPGVLAGNFGEIKVGQTWRMPKVRCCWSYPTMHALLADLGHHHVATPLY